MHQKPNGPSEHSNRQQPLPGPIQVSRLNREDRDHEIVAESRMAQERAVAQILFAQPGPNSGEAKQQDKQRHGKINGQERAGGDVTVGIGMFLEVLPKPVSAGPEKAEPCLQRRTERSLG